MSVSRQFLHAIATCVVALSVCAFAASAQADVLLLKNGGRVEGALQNPKQEPRTEYILKLDNGGEVTLAADQVARVVSSSPAEQKYLRLLKKMPANAKGNFKMAEICAQLGLAEQRTYHLEEVILIDPDHEKARRALKHVKLDGQWGAPEDLMQKRGYVKYKGRWRLPQDIQLIKQREESDLAQKKWNANIKLWRSWLGKRRDAEARANLARIEDPMAAKGLILLLAKEQNLQLQEMLIGILGRLQTTSGTKTLINLSLTSPREETRQLCLDQLVGYGREAAMLTYLAKLKSPDNQLVRRAGLALQRVADRSAMEPLIDALVTTHRFKIVSGGPGSLNASQGSTSDGSRGVTGFGVGGNSRTIEKEERNREVLDALLNVADGANFQYDESAWQNWLLRQTTPEFVDLRRG